MESKGWGISLPFRKQRQLLNISNVDEFFEKRAHTQLPSNELVQRLSLANDGKSVMF
jgi:hypothetical protein